MLINNNTRLKAFSFSHYMTAAIIVSFFPIYFDSLGYSKMQIGMIYSIGPATAIASNLVWGIVSDKLQTLKKTILIVLGGQFAMVLLLFRFDAYSVIFIIMTGFYFFQTPINGLNDSQILLATRQNGKSYASFRVFGSLGFAFSAVSFGIILGWTGTAAIGWIATASIFLSLLLALTLKDARAEKKHEPIRFSAAKTIFLSKKFLLFLLPVFIVSIAHRMNDGFLALFLIELGASQKIIGYSWMTSALCEVPVFFLLSRYGHRFKELPLLAIASAGYAVRFALMSLVVQPSAVIAIQMMHSVTYAIFLYASLRYIQLLVPDEYRATGQAVYNVTWSGFAGLISGIVGGRIFDLWGGSALYQFSSAVGIAACICFLCVHQLDKESSRSLSANCGLLLPSLFGTFTA